MQRYKFLNIMVALALIMNALIFTTASAASCQGRSTLPGSIPSWANSKNYVGATSPSTPLGFRVYLGWNNPSAVEALARAVSDPHSSSYGQFLSAGKFRQQFAPSQADVSAVQSWLKSQGFTVVYTPTNNHYVAAEGTVAQAQAAF